MPYVKLCATLIRNGDEDWKAYYTRKSEQDMQDSSA
jgi:hypothetical protein